MMKNNKHQRQYRYGVLLVAQERQEDGKQQNEKIAVRIASINVEKQPDRPLTKRTWAACGLKWSCSNRSRTKDRPLKKNLRYW